MDTKASGDCPDLNPQPLLWVVKSKKLNLKDELELNKFKLAEMKKQMKFMKERVKKFSEILQKEVGDGIDMRELSRHGSSDGWQGRAQMIMTLRLKLIAMRSKFLDPPHKMYYKGPFDPKKEFDLKFLPQKENNLYERMLAEKKNNILRLEKPVAVLQKEFDELSLMHRAARFRTKSLTSTLKNASKRLETAKQTAETDLRSIEAMMAHQSLFKMMIEKETFRLDPTLKRHMKPDLSNPPKISEWSKFKMMLDKSQRETFALREAIIPLTAKLDELNKNLVESKKVDTENRLRFGAQNNLEVSAKDKNLKEKTTTDSENEYKLLIQENRYLSQFLLTTVLMAEEDFKLFTNSVDIARQEFLKLFEKEND